MPDPRMQVISSPYFLGHREVGMGGGPTALLAAGLLDRLRAAGHDATLHTIEYDGSIGHEIGAAVEVCRRIAAAVADTVRSGAIPFVLGGNCNVCLGVIAGLARPDLGMVWLDAHGDFHSPDTTASGFFDGFPLSMAVGRTWKTVTATIPGFTPVAESNVVLAGHRDVDPGEDDLIAQSALRTYDGAAFRRAGLPGFAAEVSRLASTAASAYLHVDLDVIDGDRFRVNAFAPGGGLDPNLLTQAMEVVGQTVPTVAASLNCYDPTSDPDGETRAVGLEVAVALADACARVTTP